MIAARSEGAVGWITLAAPARHNALTRAGMEDLGAAVDAMGADTDLRAVVLTGEGRSFCAGAALDEVAVGDWTENPLTRLAARVSACPVPVIAALNGSVYGGGVDLALACDFRIGVRGMVLAVPAARLGIHYPVEGLARATAALGPQMARRIFLRAERFDDEALLASGFLDALVAVDALAEAARGMAAEFAALAPLAVRGMKATLAEIGAGAVDAGAVRARMAACLASEDHREGLAAQREKRQPRFGGR